MSQTNYCANCEPQDRPTYYEGGTVCRTCYLFADLQVATHHIRVHQPGMLTIFDSVLADDRTFAHRIINQDNQGGIVAGATKHHQQRGMAMLSIAGQSSPPRVGSSFKGPLKCFSRNTKHVVLQQRLHVIFSSVWHKSKHWFDIPAMVCLYVLHTYYGRNIYIIILQPYWS